MPPDVKANFFLKQKPEPVREPVTMTQIQFLNDEKFRAGYAMWLHDNFDSLVAEYQEHGRYLTLSELDIPLDI